MEIFTNISRVIIILLGLFGFIFGQLFFNSFSLGSTMAGVFGILAAVLVGKPIMAFKIKIYLVIAFSFLSITGITIDAFNYYIYLNTPGNNFGWHLVAPYIVCLILINWFAITAHLTRRSSGTNNP
jgi:hypothetical protein